MGENFIIRSKLSVVAVVRGFLTVPVCGRQSYQVIDPENGIQPKRHVLIVKMVAFNKFRLDHTDIKYFVKSLQEESW